MTVESPQNSEAQKAWAAFYDSWIKKNPNEPLSLFEKSFFFEGFSAATKLGESKQDYWNPDGMSFPHRWED